MPDKLDDLIVTYIAALEKFSQCSKVFLQHADLLNQARSEYQKAAAASRELRTALATDDVTLRTLMTQLERAVGTPLGDLLLDKQKLEPVPEPAKGEAMKASASAASLGAMKIFP